VTATKRYVVACTSSINIKEEDFKISRKEGRNMPSKKSKSNSRIWKLLALISEEGTLASLSVAGIDEMIGDNRVTRFKVKNPAERQLMLSISRTVYGLDFEDGDFQVDLIRHRKIWELSDLATIGFIARVSVFSATVLSEPLDFPFMYYLAATYGGYTLEIVQSHVAEIAAGYHTRTAYSIKDQVDNYLKVMKEYNKSLPEEVKLWLELR
jgi:hypothetical protein